MSSSPASSKAGSKALFPSDLSQKRHRKGVFSPPTTDIFSPYHTRYAYEYQSHSSCPDVLTSSMEQHMQSAPAGATRNNKIFNPLLNDSENKREFDTTYKQTFVNSTQRTIPTYDPSKRRAAEAAERMLQIETRQKQRELEEKEQEKALQTVPPSHTISPYAASTGYTRNVSQNIIGGSEAPFDGETTYKNMTVGVVRQLNADVALPTFPTHGEHSAFSRGVLVPPADGVGSEDMKLSQLQRTVQNDPTRVYPPTEHLQTLEQLKRHRVKEPQEFHHVLLGGPRYISTYGLEHCQDWKRVFSPASTGSADGELPLDVHSLKPDCTQPTIANGGVTNVYQTSYARQCETVVEALHKNRRSPQVSSALIGNAETGFVINTTAAGDQLYHVSDVTDDVSSHYSRTSQSYGAIKPQHHAVYESMVLDGLGSHDSAYSKEHATALIKSPLKNIIHPTVKAALSCKEVDVSGKK